MTETFDADILYLKIKDQRNDEYMLRKKDIPAVNADTGNVEYGFV